MITYQVEVVVPDELVEKWCSYMTSEHIDDVVRTGYFTSARLVRVSEPAIEGSVVFRVIYTATSHQDLETYRRECAPALQAHHTAIYGNSVKATRSITEDVWTAEAHNPNC